MPPTLEQIKNISDFVQHTPLLYVIDDLVSKKEIRSLQTLALIPSKYNDVYAPSIPWNPPPAGMPSFRSGMVGLDELNIVLADPTNHELQMMADARFLIVTHDENVVLDVFLASNYTTYNSYSYEITFNFLINRRINL